MKKLIFSTYAFALAGGIFASNFEVPEKVQSLIEVLKEEPT